MAPRGSSRALVAAIAAAIAAGAVIGLVSRSPDPADLDPMEIAGRAAEAVGSGSDPRAWDPDRRAWLEARAALGSSHVIYAKSPGGVVDSARRTASWRGRIETAAGRHGVDPDTLEAMVFLESAGRPEVIAGPTPESAAGLGQILPSTATDLLGMRVDLERSIRLTRRIDRAGSSRRAERLRARRARIDERFDPEAALEGSATYLEIAAERFGADDLAVVSYHMGIGNLETVIRAYAGAAEGDATEPIIEGEDLSYAKLYFDTGPDRHEEAHRILTGLGDESADYLWKVRASERIMSRFRDDRGGLRRTAMLATAKATLEELFHPEPETEVLAGPDDVREALAGGELAALPADPSRWGWSVDPTLGEHAAEVDASPETYRALRPEALAALTYIGATVRELSGVPQPLRVTSAVRDRAYQERLAGSNPEATHDYSLHTTGWAFDVLREYEDQRQARAFQFVLDRLSALALIDYAVEPRAIHVTVSGLARALLRG